MACSCNKKTIVYNNKKIEIFDKNIFPFDSCLECVKKHLGYSLLLYNFKQYDRGIIEIYLAYKHLQKKYSQMAKLTFETYKKFLNHQGKQNDIKQLIQFIIQASKIIQEEKEIQLNLEEELSKDQLKNTYIFAAYELMFHQFGYSEVNKTYAIGFLQKAVQLQNNELKKQIIRSLWKEPFQQNFEQILKDFTF